MTATLIDFPVRGPVTAPVVSSIWTQIGWLTQVTPVNSEITGRENVAELRKIADELAVLVRRIERAKR